MTRAKILAVTPSGVKFGQNKDKDLYLVVTEPPSPSGIYKTFSQTVKDKIGQELDFNVKESDYKGKIEYVMEFEKTSGGGGFGGGRAPNPKFSPEWMREELERREEYMALSYAKDILVELIKKTPGTAVAESSIGKSLRNLYEAVRSVPSPRTTQVLQKEQAAPKQTCRPPDKAEEPDAIPF